MAYDFCYEQYIYDNVGNRTSHTRNFSPTAYSYLSGTNQLTAVTGANLADSMNYDADGAIITRKKERSMGNNNYLGVNKETFGYNYAGVVRRYERTQNYQTLGSCADPIEETSTIWKYRYNAGAERELKWLQSADLIPDIAKNWVYYQLGADKRQHGVYNGRETVAPDLCSNMDNRVHWFPTEYLTYGLGGTPLISYKPYVEDGETYYIADHLGNTRVTLSTNGNVVSAKDFEPFGKELHSNGNDRLTFIGKEKDAESDLGDFGVRKYEAEYGRFLQVEPQWERYISLSTYQYGCNNPLLLFDITGFGVEDVNRFLQNANQHLNYIAGLTQQTGKEYSGFLIGKPNENWVKWAGNTVQEGTTNHSFTPPLIGELDDASQPKYEWGEGVIARAHSHPGGTAFSPEDIATFAFTSEYSSEKSSGNFSIVEAGNKRYVLEINDRKSASEWYNQVGPKGIEKIWWSAFQNAKGTEEERKIAAVSAVVKATNGALSFYQTTDKSKTIAEEVK